MTDVGLKMMENNMDNNVKHWLIHAYFQDAHWYLVHNLLGYSVIQKIIKAVIIISTIRLI